MATVKLADTSVGQLWLPRLRTWMIAFLEEHPTCGLTIEQVYGAINTDISSPQTIEEIKKQVDVATALCDALMDDVTTAESASRKRSSPPRDSGRGGRRGWRLQPRSGNGRTPRGTRWSRRG